MTEGIITFLVVAYCIVQSFVKKSKFVLFLAAIIFSLQLTQWPFFLPSMATASALGLASACFCFYDFYKKREKQLFVYGLVFLYFFILGIMQPA